jgi:subtilisin family serine protease
MATKRTRPTPPPPQKLDRDLMEQLLFGTGRARRFTQDSPVLPDVWLEYAKQPADDAERPGARAAASPPSEPFVPLKLLLTPYREVAAGDVRFVVRRRLLVERKTASWRAFGHDPALPRVVYNQSTVAATLHFEDLIRVVLPMTKWWARLTQDWKVTDIDRQDSQRWLAQAIKDPENPSIGPGPQSLKRKLRVRPDLLWLIRVVGALAIVRSGGRLPRVFTETREGVAAATAADWLVLVRAVADMVRGVKPEPRPMVHSVNLNREASPTVAQSTLAIKADAARRLFEISCRDLTWAVIDSGIDAEHPAFRQRDPKTKAWESQEPFVNTQKRGRLPENCTRIVETYDFTQIDVLLDPDTDEQPAAAEKRLREASPEARRKLREQLEELNNALRRGRSIDWGLVAPFIQIPHAKGKYVRPGNDHGTHVAGILAGDWQKDDEKDNLLEENLVGVCPDLRLYDLRVLDAAGRGDEFAVMAALQFVRYLNSTNEYVVVHGVNLSLSIPHEISNYACGRTPVCDECERVVSSGVVVVAAAGNQGRQRYTTAEGRVAEAYLSISITDPGNAETVITVGATHRYRPHTYGVSYFSSRGPTGDGRIKPDLVAPGEKITAPVPQHGFGLKDGTSMAAPHVSGAAALLMARHNELVGRPMRIKQILCSTATDLGRERYFQGAGMLDVLRALQSV